MDERIQSLARRVRAQPGDLEQARRYRAELLRLAASHPEDASPLLDELEGVFASTSSGLLESCEKREVPAWVRVGPEGRAPILLPRLPREPLRERWRARGVALWLSVGVVLLDAASDHSLEARDAASGELLWSVPSVWQPPSHEDRVEVVQSLPWSIAPWGAIEVSAFFEGSLEYRRIGRHHPSLGRVTEREVVGRSDPTLSVELQVVVPSRGSWSTTRSAPDHTVERAEPGRDLCGVGVCLERWDDELIGLQLDVKERAFAVRWRDMKEDWAIFNVYGDAQTAVSVGAAGWTQPPGEEPFLRELATCGGPGGTRFEIVPESGLVLRQLDAHGELLGERPLPAELDRAVGLGADGHVLVIGRTRSNEYKTLAAPWGSRDVIDWPLGWPTVDALDGRELSWWPEGAGPVLSGGRLYVQLGSDEVVAYA